MSHKLKKINSILYVEDEKKAQDALSEVLERFCENLYLADDGVQGLTQYKRYSPDVVITDLRMPFMDGIEMCKKIKELNNETYIIFATAFNDTEYFQEAIELQVDGYLLKPIKLKLLENKIVDIIKKIEIKKDLEQKEQMLIQQSKLAAMGEMIGNIAHQWRQPLSIISMNVNNLQLDCKLDEINKDTLIYYANSISTQVTYLSNTIDDFRNFFKQNRELNSFNIKEFIDKCINLVKASFDDNNIEVIEQIDDRVNTLGDSNQLSQALINILNNAKDALKEAQEIQKKLVFILTIEETNGRENIIITIKDNAGGIPESIIDRVFEPYFTTKHHSQGTGLGLYITYNIITKNLKGTIYVENEEFEFEGVKYKGAKFTIKLPLKPHI